MFDTTDIVASINDTKQQIDDYELQTDSALLGVEGDITDIVASINDTKQQIDDYELQTDSALLGVEGDITDIVTDIDLIDSEARNIAYRLQINDSTTEDSDLQLLQAITKDASSREDLRLRLENNDILIDATVLVDPITGTITNRAFSFIDDSFNQAVFLIDGVEAQVSAVTERIDLNDNDINVLTSELLLVPAQITATATAIVSESLAALQPVYSFNFFDSAQGWVAVNGTLTESTNKISVVLGDIQNTSLGYSSTDNKLIRVTLERTSGDGWDGSVIITRDDASTETFSNYITEPTGTQTTLLIDFTSLLTYSGTITGVRLILGTTTADAFDITSISIGKADASTQDLQNITARVSQAEIDIDANNGAITQRVTVTDYNNNTVTFSNAAATIDGLNSIIALEASRQLLVDNETITRANEAKVTIDGYTGTITALAQTVTDNQDENFTSIQQAVLDIDSVGGRITNNVFGLITSRDQSEDEGLVALLSEIDIANIKKNDLDRDVIFADAISQLNIDVSPTGAIAESITNLSAVVSNNDIGMTANANEIIQVNIIIDGNSSAISQLELEVLDTNSGLTSAITRIDAVEIDASDNASAISSVDLRVDNTNTSLTSAITRIDAVEIDADDNASAISSVDLRVDNTNTNVTAAVTRIDAVEIDADDNATAISNIASTLGGVGSTASSALTLSTALNDGLAEYRASAQLAVDANGNLSFIQLDATPNNSVIIIKTDQTQFLDNNNNPFITFDSVENSAAFSGVLKAGKVIGGEVIGALVRTADTGRRTEVGGPEGYMIWSGTGSKTDTNATFFLKENGDAYFGGTLSAGLNKNAGNTTLKTLNPSIVVGPFSATGANHSVVYSFSFAANSTTGSGNSCPTNPVQPSATMTLERSTNGSTWTHMITNNLTGTTITNEEPELGCIVTEGLANSFTTTDTNTTAGNYYYRLTISSQQRYHSTLNINSQTLSVVSTEE
jgi:hypothetical protein